MPVRPRRSRRHRRQLTVSDFINLTIGPAGDPSPHLGLLFREHRRRFGPDDWCVRFWEHGIDTRCVNTEPSAAVDNQARPPGCA